MSIRRTTSSLLVMCFVVVALAANAFGAVTPDVALDPPQVIKNPGPEYAGSTRIFQGIPGLERAANGRLWATWYGGGPGEGPYNYCMLATSGDDGATWTDVNLIVDIPGDVRAFDPCLWHDPDGCLWFFWAQGYSLWDGRSGVWAITTTESDKEQPTWSEPRRIYDGIMMNKPTVLSSGEWLLPVAVWALEPRVVDAKYAFDIAETTGSYAVCSTDHGETWTVLGKSDVPERQCDEHMFVERHDGRLWAIVRTKYGIGESFSTDKGTTWSEGRPSHLASIPHARFFIRRLASGKLLMVRNAPPEGGARTHMTAFLSDDDGATWSGGLLLDDRTGVSYPDGVQAPDGRIYMIHDRNRHSSKEVLMSVFREEDVAAGKCVSDDTRLQVLVNKATGTKTLDLSKVDIKTNEDGASLMEGARAAMTTDAGEVKPYRKKAYLFTDRKYRVEGSPAFLLDKDFVYSSIDATRAVCTKPGVAFMITPLPDRNNDSVTKALLDQGFEKAQVEEFLLFGQIVGNICSVYQKELKEGDTVEVGKWGVLIF
ncbi:MAG: exo-alpha-sialidase [bacterium]|nr:exo-alpha-sialidase [bacterium]